MEGLETMMELSKAIMSLESISDELATYELDDNDDDEFNRAMSVVADAFRNITKEAKRLQKATLTLYQLSESEGLEWGPSHSSTSRKKHTL